MKATIKAISFFLLIAIALLSFSPTVLAKEEFTLDSQSKAKGIYLYSYDAGRVLYSKGEDVLLQPASSAKMMAGLVVCEFFADKLDKRITVRAEMLSGLSGATMGLREGMSVSLEDLLYGTVCGGNNDAAMLLPYACSLSTEEFVEKMNSYASLLDMRNTHYANVTGLDAKSAQTTVKDTAKLAAKAIENELYLSVSSTAQKKINDTVTVYNRNALISQFSAQGYLNKNASGLIAGSTDEGGYVLATYATSNGRSLLCVVMGAQADSEEIYSYAIANDLIRLGFKSYSKKLIAAKGKVMSSIDVDLVQSSDEQSVNCVVSEDIYAFLPNSATEADITCKVYLHTKDLTAPIEKDRVVGGVDYYYKNNLIAKSTLVTAQGIEANSLLLFLEEMKDFLTSSFFLLALAFIFILTFVYLFFIRKKSPRKRVKQYNYIRRR